MDQNSLNALSTLFTLVTEVQSDPPKAALKLFRFVGENKREGATFSMFLFFSRFGQMRVKKWSLMSDITVPVKMLGP